MPGAEATPGVEVATVRMIHAPILSGRSSNTPRWGASFEALQAAASTDASITGVLQMFESGQLVHASLRGASYIYIGGEQSERGLDADDVDAIVDLIENKQVMSLDMRDTVLTEEDMVRFAVAAEAESSLLVQVSALPRAHEGDAMFPRPPSTTNGLMYR